MSRVVFFFLWGLGNGCLNALVKIRFNNIELSFI